MTATKIRWSRKYESPDPLNTWPYYTATVGDTTFEIHRNPGSAFAAGPGKGYFLYDSPDPAASAVEWFETLGEAKAWVEARS